MDTNSINVIIERVSLADKALSAIQSPIGFAVGCAVAVGVGFYTGCKLSQRRDAAAAAKFQKDMEAERDALMKEMGNI